jgi:EAL domain-containing protein (putative c-di-GMP-specific phosphodiesterase class I)
MGLRTIAEFVETQAVLDCLRELGGDYAQGYAISRPGPLAERLAAADGRAVLRAGATAR